MASDPHAPLRRDVRQLGEILGSILRDAGGAAFYKQVERVRRLSKAARRRALSDRQHARQPRLERDLTALSSGDALQLARAFAHFLTLANVAEQHHRVRRSRAYQRAQRAPQPGSVRDTLLRLRAAGLEPDAIASAVRRLNVEFVFTAHPTEISRRSLLQKYNRIDEALATQDRPDLTPWERRDAVAALRREATAIWFTDELRRGRPTPQDEAMGGLLVFEQTLWNGVPRFLRALDEGMQQVLGVPLPADAVPLSFGSWMGGDRDGNPNVTAEVTREVVALARWLGTGLYLREIRALHSELSMATAGEELLAVTGESQEPYRTLLRGVEARLERALGWLAIERTGRNEDPPEDAILATAELESPLDLCDRSLRATGLDAVANGRLLDLRRRLQAFGLNLVRLDIRQEADRHTALLDAVTRHLGMGSYAEWGEEERQRFLRAELAGRRPLIPDDLPCEAPEAEVLATLRMLARLPAECLGAYVISMAMTPSDVLAVELLQRAGGMAQPLRVVPLFETLPALQGAGAVLQSLYGVPEQRERVGSRLEVMVGYSDSAKQSGRLASAWALYRAQEEIVTACRDRDLQATIFHGRGGTVGRGGGPTRQAIRSLPPGAVDGSIRLTVQGEMIQAEFGTPGLTHRNLELTLMATLEATLQPGASPPPQWRALMDRLAADSAAAYQAVLARDDFVPFFRSVTPERELGRLNVGSRPARRAVGPGEEGGLDTLRAIPWVFAWTQVRLMLPAWLGAGEALQSALERGEATELQTLYADWPFFRTTVQLIEMVLAKAEPAIFSRYAEVLAPEGARALGDELVTRLRNARQAILTVTGQEQLLEGNEILRRSIDVRNPYVDPINLLQVELLRRLRDGDESAETLDALLVTMNGIAAGMRNTG